MFFLTHVRLVIRACCRCRMAVSAHNSILPSLRKISALCYGKIARMPLEVVYGPGICCSLGVERLSADNEWFCQIEINHSANSTLIELDGSLKRPASLPPLRPPGTATGVARARPLPPSAPHRGYCTLAHAAGGDRGSRHRLPWGRGYHAGDVEGARRGGRNSRGDGSYLVPHHAR